MLCAILRRINYVMLGYITPYVYIQLGTSTVAFGLHCVPYATHYLTLSMFVFKHDQLLQFMLDYT